MKKLNKNEMLNVTGGINWSGTFINSLSKAVKTIMDLGRALGSSIRRIVGGTYCPIA